MEDILKIVNKVYSKEKISFDEFIYLIKNGYEMQFFYKKRKFGSTQFGSYEFYEWNIEKGYQSYKTLEEFKEKINIDGEKVVDLWDKVRKVDFAD